MGAFRTGTSGEGEFGIVLFTLARGPPGARCSYVHSPATVATTCEIQLFAPLPRGAPSLDAVRGQALFREPLSRPPDPQLAVGRHDKAAFNREEAAHALQEGIAAGRPEANQ